MYDKIASKIENTKSKKKIVRKNFRSVCLTIIKKTELNSN